MEENEKKYDEEMTSLPQTSEEMPPEAIEETQIEAIEEVSAEPPEEVAPAYHWDFSASPEVQKEKKKRRLFPRFGRGSCLRPRGSGGGRWGFPALRRFGRRSSGPALRWLLRR